MDMGFLVGLPAFLGEPLQHRLVIAVAQLRARVAARGPLGEDLDRCVEPHSDGPFVEQLAGARVDVSAAPRGDHAHLPFHEPSAQPALAVTDVLPAVAPEYP